MKRKITHKNLPISSASLLLLLITSVGCHFTATLWSEELTSPDGKWVVSARTDNTDTIGNVEYTIVSLKQTGFWHQPKQVMVFEGIDYQENFRFMWTSTSQLEVSVPENIKILTRNFNSGVNTYIVYLPQSSVNAR